MKIFIDTNIIISSILKPESVPSQAFIKAVSSPNQAFVCQQNIDELIRIFEKKFPAKLPILQKFLDSATPKLKIVPTSEAEVMSEKNIRDVKDRPILRSALSIDADILLTGDKDFLESSVKKPKILNAKDFVESF
jgi:putative PIN family toxin of toxin-antitoxin system